MPTENKGASKVLYLMFAALHNQSPLITMSRYTGYSPGNEVEVDTERQSSNGPRLDAKYVNCMRFLKQCFSLFPLQTSSITWRMRAPEKKPLVNLEKDDRVPQLQRAEKVRQESPIQALSEFDTSEQKRQPDFY